MSQPSPSTTDRPKPTTDPAQARRRALIPWRLAFIAYALLLTTLTHWPRLQMVPTGARPRDKIMHWLCFGVLTILLWRTRWVTKGWMVVVLTALWAVVDEMTQGMFVPGRPFSGLDLTANLLGVLSAGFVIAAMRPVGGNVNGIRTHRFDFLVDTILARPKAWFALLPQTFALAALVGGVVMFSTRWYHGVPDYGATFVATAVGAIAGAMGALAWLYRGELARFCERRTCAHCGVSCDGADVDERGWGTCPACTEPFHVGQWAITADLPRESILRLAGRAAIPSIVAALLLGMVYGGVMLLYSQSSDFRSFALGSVRPLNVIGSAIDMTVVAALLSLGLYRFRVGMARQFDCQAAVCRACGHDVHATPTQQGLGRCSECGTEFMRV